MNISYSKDKFVIPARGAISARTEFADKIIEFLNSDYIAMKIVFDTQSDCARNEAYARGRFRNNCTELIFSRREKTLYITKKEKKRCEN